MMTRGLSVVAQINALQGKSHGNLDITESTLQIYGL